MKKIAAFGEVLFDVKLGMEMLGGAPLNLSAHLQRLGDQAFLVTSLGHDDRGDRMMESIHNLNIHADYITRNSYPTGWVDVVVTDGMPDYTIHEDVAWDYIHLSQAQKKQFTTQHWDAVVFGTLAQRTNHNWTLLQELISHASIDHLVFDLNIRKHHFSKEKIDWALKHASIIKLNEDEAPMMARMFLKNTNEKIEDNIRQLQQLFNIRTVLLTLGADGCQIFHDDQILSIPAKPVIVDDTIGAGDSFSAAFLHFYLNEGDIKKAAQMGIALGGYVASKSGGVPEYDDNILAQLQLTSI